MGIQYINCNLNACVERNKERKVVLFGTGGNATLLECGLLSALKDNIVYAIDNNELVNEVTLWGREYSVLRPERLKEETSCSVIITTSVYMVEMTEQLETMNLQGDIEIYFYSVMAMNEYHPLTREQRNFLYDVSLPQRIPKVIHSFWFSGEKKPDAYQKCIDSWYRYCPDFDIRLWSLEDYQSEHPFFQRAIELKAWAYAADFARFDVLYHQGGIYMDMDVEVIKPIEFILGHEGIFSFYSDGVVDPAAFACIKGNSIVESFHHLYDDIPLPKTKKGFVAYFTPMHITKALMKHGAMMNEEFQNINGNLILPRQCMMPLDCCVYECNPDEDTFMIHRLNCGWLDTDYSKIKGEKNKAFIKNKL